MRQKCNFFLLIRTMKLFRKDKKTIKIIHKNNGDILTKQEDIISDVKAFYQELFNNNDNEL